MFDRTLTIYNKHGNMWYPVTVNNADMHTEMVSNITVNGIDNVGAVTMIIHSDSQKRIMASSGVVQYVPPKQYAALSNPAGYFTFWPEHDFVVEGSVSIIADDDDYDSGYYNELNKTMDGVHMIRAAEWFGMIPHFEVAAK